MPKKILLADDSATAQNMGKDILADAGYEVLIVNSAAAALAELPEFEPDLVILDIYMQGGPAGLLLCEQLRADPATASLPIMLAVGKMEAHHPGDVTRAGADAVIIKPFEASELVAKTKQVAELAASRPRPNYRSLASAGNALTQVPVAQFWPAAAVAKVMGRAAPMPATDAGTIAASAPASPTGADNDDARIAAAVHRVLARSLPAIVSDVVAELRKNS